MAQPGIEQRAVPVAAAGMHHQPRRLVDDEQVGVLVHDIERNVLGGVRNGFGIRRRNHLDGLAPPHPLPRLHGAAVERGLAGLYPQRQPAA